MIMSDVVFVNRMIGKRYDFKTNNCWHLVMEYYKGVVVPDYSPNNEDLHQIVAAFNCALLSEDKPFIEVITPCNGDVCVFKSKFIAHTGLWFDGKVLHNSPQNRSICLEPLRQVLSKFKTVQYFRHVSKV